MHRLLTLVALLTLGSFTLAAHLHTSGRWILGDDNVRVKLKCVNWAGHLETNMPEGLQHQPLGAIVNFIQTNGFNCVRLSYSTDLVLNPDISVKASFTAAAQTTGASATDLEGLYQAAVAKNDWLGGDDAQTVQKAWTYILNILSVANLHIVLDNHVSRAGWCCNQTDGNGWFNDASATSWPDNDRFFDADKWIQGLQTMANWTTDVGAFGVTGMGIRNELRPIIGSQDLSEWSTQVTKAANAIHQSNANLLIMIGGIGLPSGVDGGRDLSPFLTSNQSLDTSGWPNQTVWETHSYPFDTNYNGDCTAFKKDLGTRSGFVLVQNQPYTGPLWFSELGVDMTNGISKAHRKWLKCIIGYLADNGAEWGWWALQGDYYVRDGMINKTEPFGLLNSSWTGWQEPSFPSLLADINVVTQGP